MLYQLFWRNQKDPNDLIGFIAQIEIDEMLPYKEQNALFTKFIEETKANHTRSEGYVMMTCDQNSSHFQWTRADEGDEECPSN